MLATARSASSPVLSKGLPHRLSVRARVPPSSVNEVAGASPVLSRTPWVRVTRWSPSSDPRPRPTPLA